MRNRTTGVDHRLLRDLLDRHILLRNAQFVAVCEPCEVRRWTVGINVRESARYRTGPTCHFADRTMRLRLHVLAELREALPCDRGFHSLTHNAARDRLEQLCWSDIGEVVGASAVTNQAALAAVSRGGQGID